MSITTHSSDNELIQAIMRKDEKAFTILFRRYHDILLGIAFKYIKQRAEAEDLVQEIFIRVHASICSGRYNEEGKFCYWLKRVAANMCKDHLRRPNPTNRKDDFASAETAAGMAPSPEDLMITRQLHAQVRLLVSRLPEDLKKVVYYRHYEEISFKEISQKMGTNMNTSLGRMRYGLMHLRKGLGARAAG